MAKSLTIHDFFKRFPDDTACLAHLFSLRYGYDYGCPKCGVIGTFRKLAKHPAYTCNCGHHIHPMQGTIFQDSHTPLTKWFYALYLFTTTRHGVPAKELQRQLGVSYPTALRMAHLIRVHMAKTDGNPMLGGHVEVDETYVGGHTKGGTGGRNASEKVAVFGMVERGGDIMTRVVDDASAKTLVGLIRRNVDKGTVISSDEWSPTLASRRPVMPTAPSTTAMRNGCAARFTPTRLKASGATSSGLFAEPTFRFRGSICRSIWASLSSAIICVTHLR
jgi:transposase